MKKIGCGWWFAIVALVGVVALCVYAPVHEHNKKQSALKHSACAILDDEGVRNALDQPSLEVHRQPDKADGKGFTGPLTRCDYSLADEPTPRMTITIWCGSQADDEYKDWKGTSNKKVSYFRLNDSFVLLQYKGSSHERKALKSAAKEGQQRVGMCPK